MGSMMILALLRAFWQVLWFVLGPILGCVIAMRRGINPVIGFVVGFLGCFGWVILFFLPSTKRAEQQQIGRSLSVDELPPTREP